MADLSFLHIAVFSRQLNRPLLSTLQWRPIKTASMGLNIKFFLGGGLYERAILTILSFYRSMLQYPLRFDNTGSVEDLSKFTDISMYYLQEIMGVIFFFWIKNLNSV